MYYSLFGNPRNSWCDKNFTAIVLPDGQLCYNADVRPVETQTNLFSTVMSTLLLYSLLQTMQLNYWILSHGIHHEKLIRKLDMIQFTIGGRGSI